MDDDDEELEIKTIGEYIIYTLYGEAGFDSWWDRLEEDDRKRVINKVNGAILRCDIF